MRVTWQLPRAVMAVALTLAVTPVKVTSSLPAQVKGVLPSHLAAAAVAALGALRFT